MFFFKFAPNRFIEMKNIIRILIESQMYKFKLMRVSISLYLLRLVVYALNSFLPSFIPF